MRCGSWGLSIDNALDDHVAVFLGDLGGLPDREQQYWRSHNVTPPGNPQRDRLTS
jgi:hypothetical protein